jgi:hypothetical protein
VEHVRRQVAEWACPLAVRDTDRLNERRESIILAIVRDSQPTEIELPR